MNNFNENTDDQIKMIFNDYKQAHELRIDNALLLNNKIIKETTYLKYDPSKYRKAKLVKVNLGNGNGIELESMQGKTINSFEDLQNINNLVKNFYKKLLKNYEINYHINMDWKGIEITFILIGQTLDNNASQSNLINYYLLSIQKLLKLKGNKRSKLSGNWLDIKFSKKNDYSWAFSDKLKKIGNGTIKLNDTINIIDMEIVKIRNDAHENNLKFDISGGDQQVVIKFAKII
jgi:hypothetical protein